MGILSILLVALGLAQPARPPERVLFIGNSLTAANDLPGMVRTLARAAGMPLQVESVAFPDFSLEDHWRRGDAQRAIARGGWDVVVLQQGPSARRDSRALLVEYTKRFDLEIRKAGGRTALYMVWPSAARRVDFQGVGESYAAAAEAVGGLLLPVGDAWRAAWAVDPTLPLYGRDGFHPSPMATYLAALVIHREFFGIAAPPRPSLDGMAPEQVALLQRIAGR